MEQHPVPQNVTTFQFRLIGDMTIKQFGYLAVGLVLAYISYKLPLPFFITWPLAIGFGLLGFGLAFIPIEERPMDVWILSFFRNVYAPTQYVWKKSRKIPRQTTSASAQKLALARLFSLLVFPFHLGTKPKQPLQATGSRKAGVLERLFGVKHTAAPSIRGNTTTHLVTPAVATILPHVGVLDFLRRFFRAHSSGAAPTVLQSTKPAVAQPVLQPAAVPIQKQQQPVNQPEVASADEAAHRRILELQKELSALLTDRERLSKEVATLKTESRPKSQATVITGPGVTTTEQAKPTVRAVAATSSAQIGVPRLTGFPNVIAGIVKDEGGGLLPGILITVRDPNDVPIRAFKTNRIGQFVASTPLPNGSYIVEAEDPKKERVFDRIQIAATGMVMPTLEMFAKSKKQQNRDALVKEIFGQPNI